MIASEYRHKVYNSLKGKKRSPQTRDFAVTYGDDPQMRIVMRAMWAKQCRRIRAELAALAGKDKRYAINRKGE